MTALQVYLLVAPFVLLAVCGGLAAYARYDAGRLLAGKGELRDPAE